MATIYVLVWGFCVAEMVLCLMLIMPMPTSIRKLLLSGLSSPTVRHQFRTTSIVVGVILLGFFVVDMNDSLRWHEKSHHTQAHQVPNPTHLQEYHQHLQQYFRAQRNYYLSGFSFFLLIVLNRLISLLGDVTKQQQDADLLKRQVMGREGEYDRMRRELEASKKSENALRELESRLSQATSSENVLKKQAENNNTQYLKILADNQRLQKELDRLQDILTKKTVEAKKSD